jgi:large subunit ribosomal protein L6
MSRIGKKPVVLPQGIKVEQAGSSIKISGPLGSTEMDCRQIKVKVDSSAGQIQVINEHPEIREDKQLHGTTRALIANMIEGVTKGFKRQMEIYGAGYNVKEQSGKLTFQSGYCNPISLPIPKGIKVTIEVPATKGDETPAKFSISGIDKCLVGQFVSEIRKVRPPEPYKGKGIRFAGEHIKHKVGKAFTSGTVS